MKVFQINGRNYSLPNGLNAFQHELYVHLIDWKWANITTCPGTAQGHQYDAILPDSISKAHIWPHLYPGIQKELKSHLDKNNIRIHTHFYHMASSQAANINLFLPILHHPAANSILRSISPDFASLATDILDHGYCLEYWGWNIDQNNFKSGNTGPLADKSAMAGTDSDIAIAYRNHEGDLCLWLIEHKLTEKEFTECGGYKSKGKKAAHDCTKTFTQTLADKSTCYYHDKCEFKYWDITGTNQHFFINHASHKTCPFKCGMNQLWRNQLMALAIEQDNQQPFKNVTLSVVRHPNNISLDDTISAYRKLIAANPKFSVFSSAEFVSAAERLREPELDKWVTWYKELYRI